MKHTVYILFLCLYSVCVNAQSQEIKISRDYQDVSLSKVLEDLNAATPEKTIYFIYDELEDFTVTAHFSDLTLEEAIREAVGFYPMKVTYDGLRIFIECTQKERTKISGRVTDESGNPIEFANIVVSKDATFINGGVSNENGDFVIPCKPLSEPVTVRMTCIGYKTVERSVSIGNIGTITLQPETYTIGGVVVKGEIPTNSSFCRMEQPSNIDSFRYFERFKRLRVQIDG